MPDTHLTLANRIRRFFRQHPGLGAALFWMIAVLTVIAMSTLFLALFTNRHGAGL